MKNYSDDPTKQYHIQCAPGDVGRYVLLPGDPARVDEIAEYLEDAQLVADNREFRTFSGYIDGEKVSVCSTGIGGPSAAIAVEELSRIGADTFIRVGTCGGMQLSVESGDLVIATSSIRCGTSKEYVDADWPATADFAVTRALCDAASRENLCFHVGVTQSKDSFYGQHEPETLPSSARLLERWDEWKRMGCLCSEMESSAIFVVSAYRHARAGAIFLVIANQERESAGLYNPVIHDTSAVARTAVGAIRELIRKDRAEKLAAVLAEANPKAMIFDFDGTISFTEEISYRAFRDTAHAHGADGFSEEHWPALIGRTDAANWEVMRDWFPDADLEDTDALVREQRERFLEIARDEIEANSWIRDMPRLSDCRRAIVSNNLRHVVGKCVRILQSSGSLPLVLDEIVSCPDSQMSKLEAWASVSEGLHPDDVVIFEDDPRAIEEALGHGYHVVAVSHRYNFHALETIPGISAIV